MPDYPVGEGHRRSRGAVLESYAETDALEVPCPVCGVPVGEFCPNRHIPCPKRICAARKAVQNARTATNTPSEG